MSVMSPLKPWVHFCDYSKADTVLPASVGSQQIVNGDTYHTCAKYLNSWPATGTVIAGAAYS